MSTIRVGTISNAGGTQSTAAENVINGSAKAWVNFNGTGTVAIRGQYNVSSITDNGAGDYTVNFTSAMSDANYAWTVGTVSYTATNPGGQETVKLQKDGTNFTTGNLSTTTTSARFVFGNQSLQDVIAMTVVIFR